MMGIYCIYNTVTGRMYIGQSTDIDRRIAGHRASLDDGTHHNSLLQMEWDEFGERYFDAFVLEEVRHIALLSEREQAWINRALNKYGRQQLYNQQLTVGGRIYNILTPQEYVNRTPVPWETCGAFVITAIIAMFGVGAALSKAFGWAVFFAVVLLVMAWIFHEYFTGREEVDDEPVSESERVRPVEREAGRTHKPQP